MLQRPLYSDTWQELSNDKAMVFMAGPRQAGKTTLAESISKTFPNRVYWNWDIATDRKKMARDPYFFQKKRLRRDPPDRGRLPVLKSEFAMKRLFGLELLYFSCAGRACRQQFDSALFHSYPFTDSSLGPVILLLKKNHLI